MLFMKHADAECMLCLIYLPTKLGNLGGSCRLDTPAPLSAKFNIH